MDFVLRHKPPTEQGCYITPPTNDRQALAFGLVLAAGLSTSIGAVIAIALPYLRVNKNLLLASFLAIAAGVMIYVSFVEIFAVKAIFEFERCFKNADKKYALLYATLCFFAGILVTALFDKVLHTVQHRFFSGHKKQAKTGGAKKQGEDSVHAAQSIENENEVENEEEKEGDAAAEVASGRRGFTAVFRNVLRKGQGAKDKDKQRDVEEEVGTGSSNNTWDEGEGEGEEGDGEMIAGLYTEGTERTKLIRMALFAGVALAFHNFPEGLATYVSVLNDPSVGYTVALAIAFHNIPEGICVAMPIYYATNSRWWAFFWAFLSGMTELVGALLGYIVLSDVVTPEVYGVLYALVAGMMVYISIKELLPTAHVYDPKNKVTSVSFFAGMAVMAISIVLFSF